MVAIPEPLRAPIVYTEPAMGHVSVRKDLIYRQFEDTALRMDLYQPDGAAAGDRYPAVLFVHGDAPPQMLVHAKEWGQYSSWGQLAAANGMVGVTFTHRSTEGRTRMQEACADVAAAIGYVRANADELGIDPERLCFWVCSAGGLKLKLVLEENPRFIRCTVAYYPLVDLADWRTETPAVVSDTELQTFSAINHVGPGAAPLLLARAGLDHPAFNAGIDRFVQRALAQNVPLELHNHPAGQHGFDVRNADDRSREIIGQTLAFMRRHLQVD